MTQRMNEVPSDHAASLAAEVAGFRHLLDLLRAEQESLCAADADALAQVTRAKLVQVNVLQDLGATRAQTLRSKGLGTNAAGMQALLAACAQPELAREQWDTLASLAAEALRTNALNARMATVQQRHIDGALAALWTAAGRASTYGADGRSQHRATSRSLVAI